MKTFIGTVRAGLYFRGAQSLKDRRSHLRSLETRLRNMGVATAQIGPADFIKRAWMAAVCVSGSERIIGEQVDKAIRVMHNPEWETTALETDILELEAMEEI